MTSRTLNDTRDPEVIAFERTYPGVTATLVTIHPLSYQFECEGPRETLVSVGLISPAMLARMAGTSAQITFGPRPRTKSNFCPFYTQLRYRSVNGRTTDTLTMRRWFPHETCTLADVIAFCGAIGVDLPAQSDVETAIAKVAADEAALRAARKTYLTAQYSKQKVWSSDGTLITVDWTEIRKRVDRLRRDGAL